MTIDGNAAAAHLAWCGLIALQLARRDGLAFSPAQENLFLTRWLATAEKHRRFRKELDSDIRWLLKEGREKGIRADLPGKLQYLWRAGSCDIRQQPDLFRLQHALNALKLAGWIYMVLSDAEWEGRRAMKLNPAVSGIYLNRLALDTAFSQDGTLLRPLPVRITGDLTALDVLLERAALKRGDGDSTYLHFLQAGEAEYGA